MDGDLLSQQPPQHISLVTMPSSRRGCGPFSQRGILVPQRWWGTHTLGIRTLAPWWNMRYQPCHWTLWSHLYDWTRLEVSLHVSFNTVYFTQGSLSSYKVGCRKCRTIMGFKEANTHTHKHSNSHHSQFLITSISPALGWAKSMQSRLVSGLYVWKHYITEYALW